MGMDGYNWGTTQTKAKSGWTSNWREFETIFHSARKTLRQLAPNKPIFVFETASVDQGGDKRKWTRKAFEKAMEWKLAGMIWFHAKKENDWWMNRVMDKCFKNYRGKGNPSPHQWIRGTAR